MLKRIVPVILFLIVILHSIEGNAQKDSIQNHNNSYISLNLLSHNNSFSPRWRLGYIQKINENFSVGLDVGYGNKKVLFSDYNGSIGDNYRLWEIRPEFYYIDKYNSNLYLSVDLFYINNKDVFFNDSYLSEDQEEISYSRVNYRREKYGFNFKYGFIINISNKIKLNIYSGLGIRIRNNSFTDVVNPGNGEGFLDDFRFGYNYREGKRVGLNLPLGVKLFYKL